MAEQMTERQAEYRESLIQKSIEKAARNATVMPIVKALLAVNLPEPMSKRDASAQIDALKNDIRKYQTEQAQALLERVGEEGFAAIRSDIKSITGLDYQLDYMKAKGTHRFADVSQDFRHHQVEAIANALTVEAS